MSLTFFSRCEGTTLAAPDDLSGADTSLAAISTPSIGATGARIGSNGLIFDSAGDMYKLDTETAIIDRLVGSLGFYFNVQSWAGNGAMFSARGATGFDHNITIMTSGADELQLRVNQGGGTQSSLATTAANLTASTWYFVTASWDQPNHKRRIRVYSTGGTLLEEVEDLVTTFTAPTDLVVTDGLQLGDSEGIGHLCWMDNIFIGSAYDDADVIYTNRNITSATQYSSGAPAPSPVVGGRRMQSVMYV